MALVACPDCSRHIRWSEVKCPFCDAAVAARIAELPERFWPSGRLSRAALMTFATTAAGAAGAAGCSAMPMPEYGSPPTFEETGGTPNIGGTAIGGAATGGAAPRDAGSDAADAARARGGAGGGTAAPLYGLPPQRQ
jgi:hypothetical protein